MNIAELSIQKKTISLVMVFLIIAGGIFAYEGLGRLEDPEFTIKDALIVTAYPGANPMEVANEVTDKIETALQQLPQLKQIESISKEGLSIITATMKDKYDKYSLPQVWDELRRKVHDVQSELPPGAMTPVVKDDFGDVYGILMTIYGDGYGYDELKEYAKFLRKELLLVKDVAKIELWGEQQEVVYVEISRAKMAQLGIGLDAIYGTLQQQNVVTSSGNVQVGPEYIRISPTGEFSSVMDIANLQVRDSFTNRIIYLKDVAEIKRSYVDPPSAILHYNGHSAISIGISIVPGGNVVKMGDAIQERLEELKGQTPIGIEMGIVNFQSEDVREAVDGFIVNFAMAVVIVVVVLLIFMGLRSGLLIGAVLALTVLATLIAMKAMGINMERISLGALVIALGMLVDNAIVVTEGMLIRIQKGDDGLTAAKEVVAQNLMPLLGATVIAVLAFAAIGVSQDKTGEFCRSMFQVMLISLMFSWVIAITITPLFCTMFLKPDKNSDNSKDPYAGIVFQGYRQFLEKALRFRWATIGMMIVLLGLAVWGFGQLKNSFFPESPRPQFLVHYWLPAGTDIRQTEADISIIENHLLEDDRINSVASYIGKGATRFMLTFSPEKSMDTGYGLLLVSVDDFEDVNDLIPQVGDYLAKNFPNSEPKVEKFILGPKLGGSIEARFSGPDPVVLHQLATQAKNILRSHPSSYAVRDDWRQKVKVVRPQFDESMARNVGISRETLSRALATNFNGTPVGVYREGDELIPIMARAPKDERVNVDKINDIQVWSPTTRKAVPVYQVVTGFDTVWEDAFVHRRDRKLTIKASCEPVFGVLASTIFDKVKPQIEAIELPPGYEMEWGGDYESSGDAKEALAGSMPLTIVLMILIVIMLFNALRQPLIIWLTVPLAIIGVSLGLFVFNLPFDFMALLGFLSLTGMLIKNAIVLIDQIDMEIREGTEPYTAIIHSSLSRMRPVSMAAITTVLGMIPLLSDVFFQAMSVTIMAGLSFATILTLIVVPVLYAIFFNIPAAADNNS